MIGSDGKRRTDKSKVFLKNIVHCPALCIVKEYKIRGGNCIYHDNLALKYLNKNNSNKGKVGVAWER